MNPFLTGRSSPRTAAIALALTCLAPALPAQPAAPVTLDDIIQTLQANLDSYDRSIPSFLAEEHIDSTVHQFFSRGASAPNYETIADSVFRLKRNVDPATRAVTLEESRDIRTIDGKPANGRDIDAPTMVSGAFSGGLAVVSKDEQPCSLYTLEPVKPNKPIVVRFVTRPAGQRPDTCLLSEDGSGRVTIDPASMQIARIELTIPHHTFTPLLGDGRPSTPIKTRWEIQVDLKPVVLDARTFWLPSTVASTCRNDEMEWSFHATYRNYHKLEVRSRIVLPDQPSKP